MHDTALCKRFTLGTVAKPVIKFHHLHLSVEYHLAKSERARAFVESLHQGHPQSMSPAFGQDRHPANPGLPVTQVEQAGRAHGPLAGIGQYVVGPLVIGILLLSERHALLEHENLVANAIGLVKLCRCSNWPTCDVHRWSGGFREAGLAPCHAGRLSE